MKITITDFLVFAIVTFFGFIAGYIYRWRGIPFVGKWKTPFIGKRNDYSIGISVGSNIEKIQQNSRLVLSRHDVTDVKAKFVADPFLFRKDSKWYMFMEVLNWSRKLGEIGLATSDDGLKWSYQEIVLSEPFHLSYPYIFENEGQIWMIPETAKDKSVRLYRAIDFPRNWKLEKKLLDGMPFTDASVFQHKGLWWMFVSCNISSDLILYYADNLLGPWQMHPKSPIVYCQPQKARCAGRVVKIDGKLIRFAQNCDIDYGRSVTAYHVEHLDKKQYKENRLFDSPILFGSGKGWNAEGMHHIDMHSLPDGSYLAAVDGRLKIRAFGLKY